MTHDAILDRLIASDRNCGRQKRRTGRMLQCVLATWPGVAWMCEESVSKTWKQAAVEKYQAKHDEPKRRSDKYGVPVALLMLLAEIIIKALIYWFNNRELTTADLTRLHLQA